MTGLVKQQEYDWKDSNVALFGTDADRKVKKESANTEPAWNGVLQINDSCVRVWRVNKFKLEKVPEDEVGQFYNGDSYIILRVRKESDKLLYDAYFWIGKYSTQDEYATAAYKTVELDTLLDDRAVQHREVEGNETAAFKQCFPCFTTLVGGHDSGFRNVLPKEYKPRLLRIHFENRRTTLTEVSYSRKMLTSDDVYIVDLGSELIQWNGKSSHPMERMKAAENVQSIKGSRNRCSSRVVDETDLSSNHSLLGSIPNHDVTDSGTVKYQLSPAVYRVSDQSSQLKKDIVGEGDISREMVDENDVYLVHGTDCLFVYVGIQCSVDEKRNAMSYAHDHLRENNLQCAPVIVTSAQAPCKEFTSLWQ